MATLSEGKHAGEFIVSQANGTRSRETGTLASGNNIVAGELVGRVVTGTATADAGNTGNGVVGAVTIGANFQEGTYTLTCKNADVSGSEVFGVVAPDGTVLEDLTVAVAYSSQIALTIADGATDFVVGDSVTVAVAAGKYAAYDPSATDGTQVVAGISYDNYDATSADVTGCVFVVRDEEVRGSDLTYNEAVSGTVTAEVAGLKNLGIIVR
jgi:hypothetical protein